jgi:hypothetical protein
MSVGKLRGRDLCVPLSTLEFGAHWREVDKDRLPSPEKQAVGQHQRIIEDASTGGVTDSCWRLYEAFDGHACVCFQINESGGVLVYATNLFKDDGRVG